MKKILFLLLAVAPAAMWAQCNLTNSTDCGCLDGSSDCDLIPDITGSYDLLTEADETDESPGMLRISVGTPNIGHGPLRVLPTDYYICGGDTIYAPGGIDACPDGTTLHQIINQRIYHKNGSDMTFWDRNAGTMTYHPTHGHFHTDNWGIYTIRKQIDGVENPLDWPIIGEGTKTGFCLMDLADCASPGSYGYCRADDGTILTNDVENYGLGGGHYECGVNNQGISVGHMDIYDWYLAGMEIYLPPTTCNGDYMIVVQIDPNNNYLEESDDNNMIAVPITLTEQTGEDYTFYPMEIEGVLDLCYGESVILKASPVGTAYAWSNGETTSSITVTEPGTYYCSVERECGALYTDTVVVTLSASTPPLVDAVEEICAGSSTDITASGDGFLNWYDAPVGGTLLASGTTFTTPDLFTTTSFYVANNHDVLATRFAEPHSHLGLSDYSGDNFNEYLLFNVYSDITLKSVKVYTDESGEREIELRNSTGDVLQTAVVDVPSGESRIDLNFVVTPGTSYQLGTNTDVNLASFGYESPRFERTSDAVAFPYDLSAAAEITGSSADAKYYYFYDWEFEYAKKCESERVSATVNVKECVGIGTITAFENFEIYPNPSDGNIAVSFITNDLKKMQILITDQLGRIVYSDYYQPLTQKNTIPVSLNNIPKGTYSLQLLSESKSIRNIFIIQ